MFTLDFVRSTVSFVLTEIVKDGSVRRLVVPLQGKGKPLALAVMALPALVQFLHQRGVRNFSLRPGKGAEMSDVEWVFHSALRSEQLRAARERAFALASELGVEIPAPRVVEEQVAAIVVNTGDDAAAPDAPPAPPASDDGGGVFV